MIVLPLREFLEYNPRLVASDTETTGLEWYGKDRPYLYGFSDEVGRCTVVWDEDEESVALMAREILLNPSYVKIFHNAKFDWHMLNARGLRLDGRVEDTMFLGRLAHNLTEQKVSMGLDALVERWLKYDVGKLVLPVRLFMLQHEQYFKTTYNREVEFADMPRPLSAARVLSDCMLTMGLHKRLMLELNEEVRAIYETELKVLPAIVEAEEIGIPLDFARIDELIVKCKREMKDMERELFKIAGREFNPQSSDQVIAVVKEVQDIKIASTSKNILKTLEGELGLLLRRWRMNKRYADTYLEGFKKVSTNGILHPSINQSAAWTGRMSCTRPNMQNIPSHRGDKYQQERAGELHTTMLVNKGFDGFSCDYNQIELRCYADLSQDKNMIHAFSGDEIDPHVIVTTLMFGEYSKALRKDAKSLEFGLMYGMSLPTLAEHLNQKLTQTEEKVHKFFSAFPQYKEYMDRLIALVKRGEPVPNKFGRRYFIDPNESYKVVACQCQGSAADILKKAVAAVHPILRQAGGHLSMLIHDDLRFEVPKRNSMQVAREIHHTMERVVKLCIPTPVSTELMCRNWGSKIDVQW